MCGIAGIVSLANAPIQGLDGRLKHMAGLIAHRGPDGEGVWCESRSRAGFAHRRLTIIDLTDSGSQPMHGQNGSVITYNGEVYNYLELRKELADRWTFRSTSDTETILAAYDRYGDECLSHFRGMFAFAIWDAKRHRLLAARDRFGIKPFYYAVIGKTLYFASEMKALLPFLPEIATHPEALAEYLTFQYTLGEQTLFGGIKKLLPGHRLTVENGTVKVERYWDVAYEIDWDHSPRYFYGRLRELLDRSVDVHLRSDVPIGGYMSGGIDSSLISILAARLSQQNRQFFHGKFTDYAGYDESGYAELASKRANGELHQITITAADFRDNMQKVIYHLDAPVAGPGSFPQYMVSQLAARHVKVVLGGQGGDEIFGGYARYLVAYLEQSIKAALEGTYKDGNYVVTIESIVPNMGLLREYKPMMREFWREGLFDDLDARYFRLVNRASDMEDEVDWGMLDLDRVYEAFRQIFNNAANVRKEAYFDKMTHFDFKCLLPALLHVEDRMSMAHGLESRVPLLDHAVVEFAATVPADVKFHGGHMKHLIKEAYSDVLPPELIARRDKMGFPVPLKEWYGKELKDYVSDIMGSSAARTRPFMKSDKVLAGLGREHRFSRKTWGLLSLELWHQTFHDRSAAWRAKAA
jgi:asparagine synthase (glutamine-hydrolysing)